MKVLNQGTVPAETEKKTVKIVCKRCGRELEVEKADLEMMNSALDPHDFCFTGCECKCPVCKKINYTTEAQELELGFGRRGYL